MLNCCVFNANVLIMQFVQKLPYGKRKFNALLYAFTTKQKTALHPALQIMSLKSLYNGYLGKEGH